MLTYGYVRNTGSQNLAISFLEGHADGASLYNESHLPLEYTYNPHSATVSHLVQRCTRASMHAGCHLSDVHI